MKTIRLFLSMPFVVVGVVVLAVGLVIGAGNKNAISLVKKLTQTVKDATNKDAK